MFVRVSLAALAAALLLHAADSKEVDVSTDIAWTDTGFDVSAGDVLTFQASGSVDYAGNASTPDGLGRGWRDLITQLPLMESGRGALMGRFGSSPAARPFLVGSQSTKTAPVGGRLFLGINQTSSTAGSGSYHVVIQRTAGRTSVNTNYNLPNFTTRMLDDLPLRVTDAQGNDGDRVNFIVIGTEDQMKAAFAAAGWVIVDKNKKEAVLHGLLTSLAREAYVTLPMSNLMLFGRIQDYGYAQADTLKVVEARHHFRIWKAPFALGDVPVWVGAGTHDIGFDRDSRNNGITHKIDPKTDGERDYIGESLEQTGMVAKKDYLTPTHPVTDARTATGSGFTSDGRTLVIWLKPQ